MQWPPPFAPGLAVVPTPAGSASRSRSSAHSKREMDAGAGLRLRRVGSAGSSAMNSAQENSDR